MCDDRKVIASIEERRNEPPDDGSTAVCVNCIQERHEYGDHEERQLSEDDDRLVMACKLCDCVEFREGTKDDYYFAD